MSQTSIHICPVKPGSELHNERRKVLDYARPDLKNLNEAWTCEDFQKIDETLSLIRDDYQNFHHKRLHAKATPIREAVVVLKNESNLKQLRAACFRAAQRFGIEAMQIYIHKDEGHYAEDGTWKANIHAHIVFNWYNFYKHSTFKLNRQHMAELQTIFAEELGMQRGESSDRKHLSALQQKNKAEAAKLKKLTQAARQMVENLCKNGEDMVSTFDALTTGIRAEEYEIWQRDKLSQACKYELPTDIQELSDHAEKLSKLGTDVTKVIVKLGTQIKDRAVKMAELQQAAEVDWQAEYELQKELNKELSNDIYAACEILTSLHPDSVKFLEENGVRETLGTEYWDTAKARDHALEVRQMKR